MRPPIYLIQEPSGKHHFSQAIPNSKKLAAEKQRASEQACNRAVVERPSRPSGQRNIRGVASVF